MAMKCRKCSKNSARQNDYVSSRKECNANHHIACVNNSNTDLKVMKSFGLLKTLKDFYYKGFRYWNCRAVTGCNKTTSPNLDLTSLSDLTRRAYAIFLYKLLHNHVDSPAILTQLSFDIGKRSMSSRHYQLFYLHPPKESMLKNLAHCSIFVL